MNKRITLGLVTTAAMVAAIGGSTLAADEAEAEAEAPVSVDLIEGLPWTLERMLVEGVIAKLPDDITITLLLEDGSVSGNGGCNDYFGSYTRDGDALSFSGIGSTEMYCEGASELEAAYFANLEAVTAGFSTGGPLVMTGETGEPVLEFLPDDSEPVPSDEQPIPTDGIEGNEWHLESLVDPATGELTHAPADVVASMTLENGTVTGDGGCNGYSAEYRLDGASLSFGPVLSTKMACPEPAMGIELAFFAQLEAVASWASDGGSVTLFDADGAELARLVSASEG